MDRLTSLLLFVRAAQQGNFTAAARLAGTSPSSISRAVRQLEERLGVRLLNRTTRSIALTEEGLVFFERCRQILGELEEAETVLSQAHLAPTGTLKLNFPAAFGRMHISPALPRFIERYPQLQLEVGFDERQVNLIEQGVDAIVRIGRSPDSSLQMRPLARARLITCAAPAYLARTRIPHSPAKLEDCHCLNFVLPQIGRPREWQFSKEGSTEVFTLPVPGRLSFDDPQALLTAAVAGGGLIQMYNFLVWPAIASGTLIPVLEQFAPPSVPISVLYPQKKFLPARVGAFLTFLDELVDGLRKQHILD